MVTMKVLKSREEWLENRKNALGGSDIAAVIGANPYMSNVDLWEIKTGRKEQKDISNEPYVKYGTEAEAPLRELFKLNFPHYKMHYVENNSWTNSKYPFAQASVDGWLTDEDGRRGIWECKTTNIVNSLSLEKWKNNSIPQNYYCQCLFYMAVLEADFCVLNAQLKSEFDGEVRIGIIHRSFGRKDVEDDIEYLMKKGAEFWAYVKNDKMPDLILPEI